MNKELLRSIMALHGDTNKDLAAVIGRTEQSVSAKINENGAQFTQGEIARIQKHYHLSPNQIVDIFFR